MKILSGEGIKASKVGYFGHESNVRDAHLHDLIDWGIVAQALF